MKQLLILTAIIFTAQISCAQSHVTYTYDDAGNRITRQTVIIKNLDEDKNNDDYKTGEINEIFGEGNITIYPNPTDELLTIQFKDVEIKEDIIFQLYDINGRLVKSRKTKNNKTTINLSNNTAGTYILKIISGKNKAEFTVVKK